MSEHNGNHFLLAFTYVFNIHRRRHLKSIRQRYLRRRDNQSLSASNTFSLHPISWSVICFIANGKSMFIQHTGHDNDSARKKKKRNLAAGRKKIQTSRNLCIHLSRVSVLMYLRCGCGRVNDCYQQSLQFHIISNLITVYNNIIRAATIFHLPNTAENLCWKKLVSKALCDVTEGTLPPCQITGSALWHHLFEGFGRWAKAGLFLVWRPKHGAK